MDKTITNSWYDIEIDPATQLPVSIRAVILTGSRGGTESMGKKITGGEHVAFHFTYKLSESCWKISKGMKRGGVELSD